MSNINFQQGKKISNKQGDSENISKGLIIGIVSAVVAGLILFYFFGVR